VSKHRSFVAVALVLSTLLATRADADPFRVCADPDNLPFTSADPNEKGMYLELAELIAARLGTVMEPVFFRTGSGLRALRPTLLAGRCDAFFGMPHVADGTGGPAIRLTRPFVEVGYAVLAPRTLAFTSLGDLDGKTVGVEYASTPQTLLSVRERVRMVTFKTTEEAMTALGKREIDTAFVWGPVAGYRASRLGLREQLAIVSVAGFGLRGQAAIGVRAADHSLRERLNREIATLGPQIRQLAEKYHFPLDPPIDLEAVGVAAADTSDTPAPTLPPAAGKSNPFRGDPAVAAAGRTLFNVHCSHCHSPNAASPDPQRDLRRLHRRYREQVNEVFYATVTQGRPTRGMPPWGEVLSEETIWRIKTFLESIQTAAEN
jgi:ABC-type amino acid transport substrate-binding protein/mono/diheme cytochrome c family protein